MRKGATARKRKKGAEERGERERKRKRERVREKWAPSERGQPGATLCDATLLREGFVPLVRKLRICCVQHGFGRIDGHVKLPMVWSVIVFPDDDYEKDEQSLGRFRSFGCIVAVSPEIGPNIIQRIKIIRNSRVSFRGNRRDLCAFMHRVGGCARTYVGGSRNERRGSEEEEG